MAGTRGRKEGGPGAAKKRGGVQLLTFGVQNQPKWIPISIKSVGFFLLQSLKEFKVFENIILDDFDENIDENLMYTLFNIADQDNKFVLINS